MILRALAPIVAACAIATAGCASSGPPNYMVPLLSTAGMPVTQTPSKEVPLEIITRSTNVADPLPVDGALITYGDIETTLGHAISTAAVPWADLHRAQRPEGWQLFVELTRAEASYREGRLLVALDARATLRTRYGRIFLAQTRVNCRQGGIVPVERGAPVIFTCMEQVGRDLAGWLGQVEP
jgi:hypothetical protein